MHLGLVWFVLTTYKQFTISIKIDLVVKLSSLIVLFRSHLTIICIGSNSRNRPFSVNGTQKLDSFRLPSSWLHRHSLMLFHVRYICSLMWYPTILKLWHWLVDSQMCYLSSMLDSLRPEDILFLYRLDILYDA